MGTPFFQQLDPSPAPAAVQVPDSPPDRPDALDGNGMGTAPYDISAPPMNVTSGFPDYEATGFAVEELRTPIQGEPGSYPAGSTTQPGITQFMAGLGAGVDGVPPERGDMGPGGGDYPGTMQDGLRKYGTS